MVLLVVRIQMMMRLCVPLTPGVNGPESTWQVKHIEQYGTSSVKIYNRNGQLVFSKNYQNDWGGTYQETELYLQDRIII